VAERYLAQLGALAAEHFDVAGDAVEESHVQAFLDYCVSRPVAYSPRGRMLYKPASRYLPEIVRFVQDYCTNRGLRSPMSSVSHEYACQLRAKIAPETRRAVPLLQKDVDTLIDACITSTPHGLRMRVLLLLFWDTWARPSELLRRRYPDDIDASDQRGIVITVRSSKVNSGPEPEYFAVRHAREENRCPVCSLRTWLEYLGDDWRGPLFPGIKGFLPTAHPLDTTNFCLALKRHAHAALATSQDVSSYSLRRGAATMAAVLDWPPHQIQRKLRHNVSSQMNDYIDAALMASLGV
jgi:integrase